MVHRSLSAYRPLGPLASPEAWDLVKVSSKVFAGLDSCLEFGLPSVFLLGASARGLASPDSLVGRGGA